MTDSNSPKVIIACEFSGTVRDLFILRGIDAVSCDVLPTESKGPHIQGDIRDVDLSVYDMMIAFPPCTYLCNSGARWLYEKPGRYKDMKDAVEFFRFLLNAPVKRKAIENPLMHERASSLINVRYSQRIQPYQFGVSKTKATCLWLYGLPLLKPTCNVSGREPEVHRASPGKDRWKLRSRTYPGIAVAMAFQWGNVLKKQYGIT